MDAKKLAQTCRALADNKKAENITVLDVRKVSSLTDYFVIATGTSEPHLRAIVDEITDRLRDDFGIRPRAVDRPRFLRCHRARHAHRSAGSLRPGNAVGRRAAGAADTTGQGEDGLDHFTEPSGAIPGRPAPRSALALAGLVFAPSGVPEQRRTCPPAASAALRWSS
jgi:ribosome silencing factor RsfS/YbeB/iojap